MAKDDKLKALDAAIAQIERQYGKGSVMKLGDNSANMNVETVPTGSLSLDIALGLGGLPKGRIIEIYGPESSGKTTVALHCVAEVQKQGGIAGFIDAEHALDPVYAKNIDVDRTNILMHRTGLIHHENIFLFEDLLCRQITLCSDWHNFFYLPPNCSINVSSEIIGIPSSFALRFLDDADSTSLLTRYAVFFETLPVTFPPWLST